VDPSAGGSRSVAHVTRYPSSSDPRANSPIQKIPHNTTFVLFPCLCNRLYPHIPYALQMDKYITQKMPTGTVIAQTVGITASLFLLGMSSPGHLHLARAIVCV